MQGLQVCEKLPTTVQENIVIALPPKSKSSKPWAGILRQRMEPHSADTLHNDGDSIHCYDCQYNLSEGDVSRDREIEVGVQNIHHGPSRMKNVKENARSIQVVDVAYKTRAIQYNSLRRLWGRNEERISRNKQT